MQWSNTEKFCTPPETENNVYSLLANKITKVEDKNTIIERTKDPKK